MTSAPTVIGRQNKDTMENDTSNDTMIYSAKDIPVVSSDIVKFDASLPHSPDLSDTMIGGIERPAFIVDETVRLFDCMPKGFENFLETGPYRRVEDYMDYDKMSTAEVKNAEYLIEQREPKENRARAIGEKILELQGYFKYFQPYAAEHKRKELRAKAETIRLRQAIQDLRMDIPRCQMQLDVYKKKKKRLIANVTRYQKVGVFFDQLIKSHDLFPDFTSIIDRHTTLVTTNKYLMKKYMNYHQYLQDVSEELQSTQDLGKKNEMVLRKNMVARKQELDGMVRKNLNLEQLCYKWASNTTQKIADYYNMYMGIQNMANSIMEIRPYTRNNLEKCTSPCEQLEVIGILIKDYVDIVKEDGIKKKQQKKRDKRKSTFRGIP